ncbi:MAG: dephospho-CoA kinase [Deltaproteobacteria bacterium]|nr:dephospho-CoA kinase [Deltaproteobacteria bacterium]
MGKLIGLTGNIGSGKSSVASLFEEKGACIIDADQLNSIIFEENKPVQESIKKIFGTLNKSEIAKTAFSDSDKKKQLERILHPIIMHRATHMAEDFFSKGKKVVLLEASQLVETGLYKKLFGLILVVCKSAIQKERFLKNTSQSKLHPIYENILQAQMPVSQKKPYAHWVIDNSGELKNTKKQVDAVWEQLQKL